ncbi:GGDEF domain-containing protein [Kutzneria kofuensis]|uniref:Diguanylate cyclase (GGDEF)-like protein n=1 Tax=Kutzneria kofuensis TaxID=103725 RepID=A0A7W9KN75_9PSEU|nr:GGDEF domain-containing protein [Kutzneria kofuensis]MBB5895664.1 diguanylate cyclase (GGDEF)-like protein [Kutzneria kofuensis]
MLSIWYVLAVDLGALAVIATAFAEPGGADVPVVSAAALAAAAFVQGEASRRIERLRRVMSGSVHINMVSVWVFAAVLTLPMSWVAVLTGLVSSHVVLRSYRIQRSYPHRQVMNAAAMVLAAWAARLVLDAGGVPVLTRATDLDAVSIGIVLAAAVVFFAVDGVLIAVSLLVDGGGERSLRDLVGSADDNALELATICIGAVIGLVLVYQPFALLFLFVPLFVLHRSVLVKHLEELATKDQKTGLLNASTWRDVAGKELTRGTAFGVLMVDLDHFKRVNDTYGHLAGDEVLKAVAGAVRRSVRDYDSVGRFGGEEFVVLLPGLRSGDVLAIAERIRRAISELRVPLSDSDTVLSTLTASIGVAVYPEAASGVDELLHAADTALYRAKRAGRNRVVSSMAVCDTRTG